jgi:hypothetical protein
MDPNFWQLQWAAFMSTPAASIFFFILGVISAWWFRGKGLTAQRQALREQIHVLEQRLAFAREQEEVAVRTAKKATDEMALLRKSRAAGLLPMRLMPESLLLNPA